MSMYSHRGMGAVPPGNSARLNELLDQIRAEFETQLRQTEGFEHQSTSAFLSAPVPYLLGAAWLQAIPGTIQLTTPP